MRKIQPMCFLHRLVSWWRTSMDSFELTPLRHFLAVCRAGSFTAAAAETGMSQSSLSRSVIRLETQIGQPLFDRRPRQVVLTEIGELFQTRADKIVSLVDDTFSEFTQAGDAGRVRLAVIPTIAPFLLPRLLKDFNRAWPEVSVVVQEDTTENIVRMCRHGEVDVAILAQPVAAKYLEVESLFDEELVLVMPRGHSLEKKARITLNDVRDFPFVMLDQAHCLSQNIESFCQRATVQPVSIERTSQLATVQELVSLDHGISMVPAMAQRMDKNRSRVYRSFSGVRPVRNIVMLFDPYRYENRWVAKFKDHLRQLKP